MSKRNTELHERINTILQGWRLFRPHKIYAGLSLDDFASLVAPGAEARAEAAKHDAKAREARARGRAADKRARIYVQRVVNGVRADPDDGEDSQVYHAMGYVIRSVRDRLCRAPRQHTAKAAAEALLTEPSKEVDPTPCPNPTASRKRSAG